MQKFCYFTYGHFIKILYIIDDNEAQAVNYFYFAKTISIKRNVHLFRCVLKNVMYFLYSKASNVFQLLNINHYFMA